MRLRYSSAKIERTIAKCYPSLMDASYVDEYYVDYSELKKVPPDRFSEILLRVNEECLLQKAFSAMVASPKCFRGVELKYNLSLKSGQYSLDNALVAIIDSNYHPFQESRGGFVVTISYNSPNPFLEFSGVKLSKLSDDDRWIKQFSQD